MMKGFSEGVVRWSGKELGERNEICHHSPGLRPNPKPWLPYSYDFKSKAMARYKVLALGGLVNYCQLYWREKKLRKFH